MVCCGCVYIVVFFFRFVCEYSVLHSFHMPTDDVVVKYSSWYSMLLHTVLRGSGRYPKCPCSINSRDTVDLILDFSLSTE